jgi:nicotinamidase-related amidase
MTKPYIRLDKNNAAVLLVDHQAGLLSLVRDIDPDKFKNNVLALGDLAKYFKLPTILTTSFETGPNGPLVPELKALFPDAPYIARPGNINAWDNEDFVKAVKATGKKQLIIAGVVTEVCVAFPALSALEEGFDVFVITDASGTFNEVTRHSAWDRMSQSGAQLMTWFGAACELHRDWRNDVEGLAALFSNHIPDYRNLITSYMPALTRTSLSFRFKEFFMSTPANFNGQRPVIDPNDAVMLLIDHQSGLFQTVGDMPMPELRARAAALARIATLAKLPVITTASVPQGPNGPLIPEIHQNAPHAQYVARKGEINAWDNPDFVAAVKASGRKTLIIAGTITSVCMAFPSISAVAEGYKVFAVVDASGTYSKMAQEITLARIVQAGVVPMDTAAVASELQKTWNRDDAAQWAEVYTKIFPAYQLLIESYSKAQDVMKNNEALDSLRK